MANNFDYSKWQDQYGFTREYLMLLRSNYRAQRWGSTQRVDKNGNPIQFELTFDEWLSVWVDSGHLAERGNKRGKYCMSRVDDIGPYKVGNVFIQLTTNNTKDAIDVEGLRERMTGSGNPMYGVDRKGEKNPMYGTAGGMAGKIQPKATCKYCGLTQGANSIGRNHNEKCKMAPPEEKKALAKKRRARKAKAAGK